MVWEVPPEYPSPSNPKSSRPPRVSVGLNRVRVHLTAYKIHFPDKAERAGWCETAPRHTPWDPGWIQSCDILQLGSNVVRGEVFLSGKM